MSNLKSGTKSCGREVPSGDAEDADGVEEVAEAYLAHVGDRQGVKASPDRWATGHRASVGYKKGSTARASILVTRSATMIYVGHGDIVAL